MNHEAPQKVSILLVDDRQANLTALRAALDDPTYNLVFVDSGHGALNAVLQEDFAVIVMDVAMPRMDGFETASLIKQRPRSSAIPIIFITASIYDVDNVYRGYSVGAVDYLHKPVDTNLLRAKIAVFVELYRQREHIRRQAKLLQESERRERDLLEQRIESQQNFLTHASSVLLSSLDYNATLAKTAQLAVPQIADVCVIDVVDPETGETRELTLVGPEEAFAKELSALRASVPSGGQVGLQRCLRAGKAELVAELDENYLAQLTNDVPTAERWRALGLKSTICTPVTARGRTLGALTVYLRGDARYYTAADLALVEDLAHRIAFALENARLYDQTQAAVRARDEFLSIASHELRTPLTPLLMQLQRLLGTRQRPPIDPCLSERVRAILLQSERHVRRLGALIDNLLDVSRIGAHRLMLATEKLNLGEVVRDVLGRFEEELTRSVASVNVDVDPLVCGTWDRLRLEQVVTNLITNALKYGRGRPISIAVGREDDTAVFSVKDEGIGIERGKQGSIFDCFERAVSARAYGGLGLGLFITRQIVEAHGGSISVESAPGMGSEFRVQLPAEPSYDRAGLAPEVEVTAMTQQ